MVRPERKDHLGLLVSKDHLDLWVQEENVVRRVLQENKDHLDWVVDLETKDPPDLLELWDQRVHLVYLDLQEKLDL